MDLAAVAEEQWIPLSCLEVDLLFFFLFVLFFLVLLFLVLVTILKRVIVASLPVGLLTKDLLGVVVAILGVVVLHL